MFSIFIFFGFYSVLYKVIKFYVINLMTMKINQNQKFIMTSLPQALLFNYDCGGPGTRKYRKTIEIHSVGESKETHS